MRTVLSYYKKYIPFLIGVLICLAGTALCDLALPAFMSKIINEGIVANDMACIRTNGLIMIVVAACCAVFNISASLLMAITSAKAARSIRKDLFMKVTRFSTAELESFSTASLITRSTNDVQMVQQATVMLRMLFFAPIMGLGSVFMALRTSVSLSWTVGLALICVSGLLVFLFIVVFPRFRVMQQKLDRINLIMKERLSGTLVIRAFRTEKHEEDRFDYANEDLTKLYIFVNKAMAFMMPTMMLIMSGAGILIVWAGAHYIDAGSLLVGDMLAYIQYAMHVIMSFMFITMIFVMLPRAAVSAKRIGEVLDTEISITDSEQPIDMTNKNIEGKLEFKGVGFAYPDAKAKVLSDISFVAQPLSLIHI